MTVTITRTTIGEATVTTGGDNAGYQTQIIGGESDGYWLPARTEQGARANHAAVVRMVSTLREIARRTTGGAQ